MCEASLLRLCLLLLLLWQLWWLCLLQSGDLDAGGSVAIQAVLVLSYCCCSGPRKLDSLQPELGADYAPCYTAIPHPRVISTS